VKHLFKWGAIYKAKKEDKMLFREDVWVSDTPLKLQLPDLYNICDDKETLMTYYHDEEGWDIGFRQSLTVRDAEQLEALLLENQFKSY
jgi:hypothetical protein